MMSICKLNVFLSQVLALVFASGAIAATISTTPAPVASGPGLGFANIAAVITVQANNDNVPSPPALDNNIIVPLKRFDSANFIDIQFSTTASLGVTEYQVTEFVDNNTGSPWSSYRMQLGRGTGANFQQSPANDGLDFDAPNYDTPPTSGAFPVVNKNEDLLVFTGGTQGSGAQPFSFRIDVPDLIGFDGTFTLRQTPVAVPEPGSLALVMVFAVGISARRQRRIQH